MRVALILAKTRNNVIGDKGGIPWRLPDDMKFFRQTTMGKPIIMGRRTYGSIGRPLPGRQNIVLSRDSRFEVTGAVVVSDFESALWAAADVEEVMVIGGAELYRLALPFADRIYLTEILAEVEGDTCLDLDLAAGFTEICRQHHEADDRHVFPFDIVVLDRTPQH